MGDKFYRLKEVLINFAVKYQLKQKATTVANKVINKTENLRTKGFTKKQTIAISSILIISLIIVLWPTTKIESPLAAISKIEQAIVEGNSTEVIRLVDMEAISQDMAGSIVQQVNSKKLTKDLLSYMQKELENKITEDFYNIVYNKGDFYKNLNDSNAVLSKTLNFLLNKSGKVIKREVIEEKDNLAVVRLTVFRPDLEKEINIDLEFNYNGLAWSLVKVKDLNTLIKKLEEIEDARIKKLNDQIKENFNNYVLLKDFQKSHLNIKENSFLMRVSLENISNEDIQELEGTLKLVYKNQLMGTIAIKISENIYANNFYEKAWSIKLTDYESLKNIAKTSSSSIKAILDIEKIVFAKGNVLELIK